MTRLTPAATEPPVDMPSIDRRTLLGAAATGSLAALAGCSSSCPDSGEPDPNALVDDIGADRPFDGQAGTAWTTPRADAGNTGYAAEATPPDGPVGVRWRTTLPTVDREDTTNQASAPAVAGDRVVVATGDGVSAIRFRDGADAWRTTDVTPATTRPSQGYEDEIAAPVFGPRGTVVVAGQDALVGLDADDGGERWRCEGDGSFGQPTVHDGTVYAAASREFVALDADDGRELWTVAADDAGGLPAVGGDTVVVSGRETRALDAATGERRWRAAERVEYYPVVDDDLVYLGDYDGLHGFDLATGERRWSFDRGSGRSLSSPVVTPDTLYLVEEPGEAESATFALDRADGAPEPRWCSIVNDGAVTAAAGDQAFGLVAGTGPGRTDLRLVAFADAFGDSLWGYRTRQRLLPPAVVDRALVVVDRAGTVVALGEV